MKDTVEQTGPNWRVLIVDDEKARWSSQMSSLLRDHAADVGLTVEIDEASDGRTARGMLLRRHYHLVSLDMLMPDEQGELSVKAGIDLAVTAARGGTLLSKLIVYSALLAPEDRNPAGMQVHAEMPQFDRYAKAGFSAAATSSGITNLTPGQWAARVVRYLQAPSIEVDFGAGDRRLSVVGCWFEHGVKHLPPVLARMAHLMAGAWDVPSAVASRVDAATAFIEICARLALTQTQVLLASAGVERAALALPATADVATCIERLAELLQTHASEIAGTTWQDAIGVALPLLAGRSGMRDRPRRDLRPGAAGDAWAGLRDPLQAAMDLAAYWALHPLWVGLRRAGDGWSGQRLAGVGSPHSARSTGRDVAFPDAALGGGIWQTALRIDAGRATPASLDWSDWLRAEADGRRWWMDVCTESRAGRSSTQSIDLESGERMSRFDA